MSVSDREAELAALRVAARAYVEWEAELSGLGIPAHIEASVPDSARRSSTELPISAPYAAPSAPAPVPTPSVPAAARGLTQPPSARVDRGDPGPAAAPPVASPAASPGVDDLGRPQGVAAGTDKRTRLAMLEEEARGCKRCGLAQGRTQAVFSRGDPDARLMFVGEGPGYEEDRSGQPFVGPAGKLLDRMVAAMGFERDAVYVCNVVKCRPPGNRTPLPEEGRACSSYLHGQLDAVQPTVIVALGRCATENLGLVGAGGGWRGRWGRFRGFDVMPTYHPAFLLRSPEFKRPVWEDLQLVMGRLKQPR